MKKARFPLCFYADFSDVMTHFPVRRQIKTPTPRSNDVIKTSLFRLFCLLLRIGVSQGHTIRDRSLRKVRNDSATHSGASDARCTSAVSKAWACSLLSIILPHFPAFFNVYIHNRKLFTENSSPAVRFCVPVDRLSHNRFNGQKRKAAHRE